MLWGSYPGHISWTALIVTAMTLIALIGLITVIRQRQTGRNKMRHLRVTPRESRPSLAQLTSQIRPSRAVAQRCCCCCCCCHLVANTRTSHYMQLMSQTRPPRAVAQRCCCCCQLVANTRTGQDTPPLTGNSDDNNT